MQNLITLFAILTPLFVGFVLPRNAKLTKFANIVLQYLVYIILFVIGLELAQIPSLNEQATAVFWQVLVLSALTIFVGLLCVACFELFKPYGINKNSHQTKAQVSIKVSVIQLTCVALGTVFGLVVSDIALPESTMTALLMILVFAVGIELKNSGISLQQVLINKQGVLVSLVFIAAMLVSGVVYALVMPEVSLFQGLALSSGYGWYSLSAIVITDAYGALWGSVALFNDLIREFFALMFIPVIMSRFPCAAVSVGGATSLDFTLPVIQQSGGAAIVPLAISFGFITNIAAPVLMVFFSSFG